MKIEIVSVNEALVSDRLKYASIIKQALEMKAGKCLKITDMDSKEYLILKQSITNSSRFDNKLQIYRQNDVVFIVRPK